MEDKERLVRCVECGKMVDDVQIDRYGECRACRAQDRATDMGVGDINTK